MAQVTTDEVFEEVIPQESNDIHQSLNEVFNETVSSQVSDMHPTSINKGIKVNEVVSTELLPMKTPLVPTIILNEECTSFITWFPNIDDYYTSHQYYHKSLDQYDDKNSIYAYLLVIWYSHLQILKTYGSI